MTFNSCFQNQKQNKQRCNDKICCRYNDNNRRKSSSKLLANVFDLASTLVNIMCIFGIHECKANKALDIIIYAFMHFDEVAEYPGAKRKKRLRKEDFYLDLIRDCGLTKVEAKLAYSIVKYAFKAFYHKQDIKCYNADLIDECSWKNAINKTISEFMSTGPSQSEYQIAERRILCIYDKYICRLKTKREDRYDQSRSKDNKYNNKCGCNYDDDEDESNDGCNFNDNFIDNCRNDFNMIDKCKPQQQPPLHGEFCCQLICPPGSKHPQFVCKDPCGRIFMKVDGNKVNFDPFLIEAEARRVANNMYRSCDADRIRLLKQSLNVCCPDDGASSCDGRLAELCKDDSLSLLCDDDDEVEFSDEDKGVFNGGIMSIRTEIERALDGTTECFLLNVIIVSDCLNSDIVTKDFAYLRILCNDDPPREYKLSGVENGKEGKRRLSKRQNKSEKLKLPQNETTSVWVRYLTSSKGRVFELYLKGYCNDNGHIPDAICTLIISCNSTEVHYKCSELRQTDRRTSTEKPKIETIKNEREELHRSSDVKPDQGSDIKVDQGSETKVDTVTDDEDAPPPAPATSVEEDVENAGNMEHEESNVPEPAEDDE